MSPTQSMDLVGELRHVVENGRSSTRDDEPRSGTQRDEGSLPLADLSV